MRAAAFISTLCVVAALLFAASAGAADSAFWSNDLSNTIGRAALDGSGGSLLTPTPVGADEPYGTAIDAATGKVYWADSGTDQIDFANLDGTGSAVLNTAGSGIDGPEGLAIDPTAGRVYWANIENDTISWAALDGSGGGVVNTAGAPIEEPVGVAVDPATGRIYWANFNDSLLGFARLDGSGGGELEVPLSLLNGPTGLAVDPVTDRLYWTNWEEGTIAWADFSGVGAGELATGALQPEFPTGIAIDPGAGKLYWADEAGFIGTVALAGGEATKLNTSGATPAEPSFPVLLEAPKAPQLGLRPVAPRYGAATLTCGSPRWEPDLVESFLYRAPQAITYGWTHDGATIAGAGAATLTANSGGEYKCLVTATNGAGSTTVDAGQFTVREPRPERKPLEHPKAVVAAVHFAKVQRDRRRGLATVFAKVSEAGTLVLTGKSVVTHRVVTRGAETRKLPVRFEESARKHLIATGKAKVGIVLTFTTGAVSPAVARQTITLVRDLTGSGHEHRRRG